MTSTKKNSVVNKMIEISTEKVPKIHPLLRPDAPVTKLATKRLPFCLPRQEGSLPRPTVEENCQNIYAISFSSRLNHTTINNNEIVNNRHKKCKAVGTIADHRMTNNNRIHRQWRTFPVIFLFILFCFSAVNLSVASGSEIGSQPVRKSHYSKPSLKSNHSVPFHPSPSPTLRSTTSLTSFLPSDAIPPTSPGPVFRSSGWIPTTAAGIIRNISISNVISVSSSGNNNIDNTSSVKISNKNHTGIVINANASNEFSRRSSSAVRRRKNSFETVTSIDRPFYTKITSQDAVAKPGYYSRGQQHNQDSLPVKKSKKHKANSSKSPKQSKKRKPVSSSSSSASSEGSEPVLDGVAIKDDNVFIPHTTEKAYRPPKLSLEPFFNFLTSLATASREVIMSKEQQNVPEDHEHDFDSGINGPGIKYSDSYDTINQSIRESAKKSKKSKKAKGEKKSKAKPNHHHFQKGSHGKRGGSVEEEGGEEEEYGPHGQQTSPGPIPIPLPNPIIDTAEMEENDNPGSSEGLHILDVLRTPMIPDYESSILPSPPRAEPFIDFLTENNDKVNAHPNNIKASANTTSQFTSNPPSGRANVKSKGQGYAPSDKNENVGANGNNKASGAKQREKQRSESGSSISDQHNFSSNNNKNNGDLQAQESHPTQVVVPSPYGLKHGVGGGASSGGLSQSNYQQHHFHHQEGKMNDPSALSTNSFQPQHRMPPQVRSSEYAKSVGNDGSDHTSDQDDIVSKYPTTFVYKGDPSAQPGPGSSPTNSRSPFMSPLGVPPTSSNHPSSFRRTKLRPNLHSYYDPNYHHIAGAGEHGEQASEMIGIRHTYGPPHFRPPPRSPQNIFSGNNRHPPALPLPPRFGNGYGNRPGYMMMSPHPPRGTHYVGQSLSSAASSPGSSKERITTHRPFDYEQSGANMDYEQDITGNNENFNGNGDTSLMIGQDLTGGDTTGSASDIDHFGPDIGNSVISDSGETKKVGIMDSFDLFYKEYKVLTWVAVFFVTSLSLLSLVVYLYINNPPTEVVQARKFPWMDQLKNPQLMKFLSSLLTDETNYGKESPEQNFKPYGKGLGAKSGRQKRKQTRSQIDKDKIIRRINKLSRGNGGGIAPRRVI